MVFLSELSLISAHGSLIDARSSKSALLLLWTVPKDGAHEGLGIALRVASAALPAVVSVKAQAPGICWRACFFEKPQCPEGWNANRKGECWMCCTVIAYWMGDRAKMS
ncbi:hypothetical protein B0H14DRAFT_2592140 [Mycena olivaceomarginata]|nr:hypothetical protein B0H14DRAFT_2592140 [Mycena olivaceomarginata]